LLEIFSCGNARTKDPNETPVTIITSSDITCPNLLLTSRKVDISD
jgi:hypothetical protein